jgi:uncharacterized membrane protein YphA (DoxX/SURF4 family)
MSPAPAFERRNLPQRVAFRFVFVYLLLYCWPVANPTRALGPWVAVHVFHLSGPVTQYHVTGSGDTTLEYVRVFNMAALSLIAGLLWSVLDRKRPNYEVLHAWLRLLVRFTLAMVLLGYGFSKVILLQMPEPSLSTLTETYGQSSPMHLLWTFMGASLPYQHFSGMAEVTAGMLLLFRRTTTIGACAAAAVMLNVAMLNFCYDVPVKLYSSHLFLMSVFLISPEIAPLWRFFVLREAAKPREIRIPAFRQRWLRIAAVALNAGTIVFILYSTTWSLYSSGKQFMAQLKQRPPLYGVWGVDSLSAAGSPEYLRWRSVIVDNAGAIVTSAENGYSIAFNVKSEPGKQRWNLTGRRSNNAGELDFTQPDPRHLVLTGEVDGTAMTVKLHRNDQPDQFLLTSRGFHWINEYPFNR